VSDIYLFNSYLEDELYDIEEPWHASPGFTFLVLSITSFRAATSAK
jgi:hypothetical protein